MHRIIVSLLLAITAALLTPVAATAVVPSSVQITGNSELPRFTATPWTLDAFIYSDAAKDGREVEVYDGTTLLTTLTTDITGHAWNSSMPGLVGEGTHTITVKVLANEAAGEAQASTTVTLSDRNPTPGPNAVDSVTRIVADSTTTVPIPGFSPHVAARVWTSTGTPVLSGYVEFSDGQVVALTNGVASTWANAGTVTATFLGSTDVKPSTSAPVAIAPASVDLFWFFGYWWNQIRFYLFVTFGWVI